MIDTLTVPPPPSGATAPDDGGRPGFEDCRGVWQDLGSDRSEGRSC